MKTAPALLALLLAATLCFSANAQQSITGSWSVQEVNQVKTPKDISLTLTFAAENKATLTYRVGKGPEQSWPYTYTYAAIENTLSLTPTDTPGSAQASDYEIRFEEGKLLLLPPKPEVEPEAEDPKTEEAEADAEGKDEDKDQAESEGKADDKTDDAKADDKKPEDAGDDKTAEPKDETKADSKADEKPDAKADAPAGDEKGDDKAEGDKAEGDKEEEEDTREPIWVLVPAD